MKIAAFSCEILQPCTSCASLEAACACVEPLENFALHGDLACVTDYWWLAGNRGM